MIFVKAQNIKPDHISVCICTFHRPVLLSKALAGVTGQVTESAFTFEVVVVDNDHRRSAEEIVRLLQQGNATKIIYDCEPEQNIALARNRAIRNATGNLLVFVDDDEFPEPTWLEKLFDAQKVYSADGVLGPVIPFYEGTPPEWLVRSGLCVRPSFTTGTTLKNSKYMRTGNVLFCRKIIDGLELPFNPRLGRSGGEDTDFFDHMLHAGRFFVWCNEARVFEFVPKERQTRCYLVKRAFIRGVTSADRESFISRGTMKSIVAVTVYTTILPIMLVTGHHRFMKYLIKDFDHLAKLFAYCGIKFARERTF